MYVTAAANASRLTATSPDTSANGSSMYPACAMLEYASSRTIWLCCSATRLPIVIVRIDSAAKIGVQNDYSLRNATNISWSSPANPAAFDAVARNAATGTGEPWYVSGAQNWNGTALTLNANPATMNRIAASASVSCPLGSPAASVWPIA